MEVGLDPGTDIEWVCPIPVILDGCVSQQLTKMPFSARRSRIWGCPMKQKMSGNNDLVGTDLVHSYP